MNIKEFLNIIRGSKQYEFCGTELTITGYYTGITVTLDLSRISEEMLEELIVTDKKNEYEEEVW